VAQSEGPEFKPLYRKKKKSEICRLETGLNGRTPAQQGQDPGFKPQYCVEKKL
jgi:hypothetical protein